MRKSLFLIALFFLTILPQTGFAYNSRICQQSSVCLEKEVGVFMQGISKGCGNSGDCTLADIMTVFVNVGNYVVGIIGGIVLLMYVIGGFFMLISGGNSERVKKGKQYMTISTVGLLIVMFSYLGIYALRGVLQYGSVALTDAENEYVACSGPTVEGKSCDLNSTCTNGGYTCESLCRQNHPLSTTSTTQDTTITEYYDCVDRKSTASSSEEGGNVYYVESSCEKNLCPGDVDVQCCQLKRR
ncbi:hypothetical protein HYV70_02725 [Candidatus Uhrbacteria bacterium]|nr:hypothetical protein [Candidatus Uhrbacteria bacterium]